MENQIMECVINSKNDITNIIMAAASVLSLIISSINIGVVIYIFKKEQKNVIEKNKSEKNKNWYTMLGIQEMTTAFSNKLNNLKEDTIKFYEDKLTQENILEKYKKVENELLLYKDEYITIVECLDSKKANELSEEFRTIQDDLYQIMIESVGDKAINTTTNIQQINIKFNNVRKKIIKMTIGIV